MTKIIVSLLTLLFAVMMHELSHFICSLMIGIPVKSVSIGFGKTLFKIGKFQFNAFPFGTSQVDSDYYAFNQQLSITSQNYKQVYKALLIKYIIKSAAGPLMDLMITCLVVLNKPLFNESVYINVMFVLIVFLISNLSPYYIPLDSNEMVLTDGASIILNIKRLSQLKHATFIRSWVTYEKLFKVKLVKSVNLLLYILALTAYILAVVIANRSPLDSTYIKPICFGMMYFAGNYYIARYQYTQASTIHEGVTL